MFFVCVRLHLVSFFFFQLRIGCVVFDYLHSYFSSLFVCILANSLALSIVEGDDIYIPIVSNVPCLLSVFVFILFLCLFCFGYLCYFFFPPSFL